MSVGTLEKFKGQVLALVGGGVVIPFSAARSFQALSSYLKEILLRKERSERTSGLALFSALIGHV